MNAFIFHGAYGNPQENWIPWLKNKLEELGVKTITPTFPTPEEQNLTSWLSVLESYRENISDKTLLVGHSVACGFILNVLEVIGIHVRACFLVAGWTGLLNNPEFDPMNRTFVERRFNWEKIRRNGGRFHIFNSDNDPYIPIGFGIELAKNLKTPLITVRNAGHFNEKAGYTQFPLLLQNIQNELAMSAR